MKVQEWKALLYNYRIIDSLFPLPLPIARLSCIGALSLAGKGHLSFYQLVAQESFTIMQSLVFFS